MSVVKSSPSALAQNMSGFRDYGVPTAPLTIPRTNYSQLSDKSLIGGVMVNKIKNVR